MITLWIVTVVVVIQLIITVIDKRKGTWIMSTLNDLATQVAALQVAQTAEGARQDAKTNALNSAIATVNATLAAVQSELDSLKAGGQTPENQAIIDKAVADIAAVVVLLDAEAV